MGEQTGEDGRPPLSPVSAADAVWAAARAVVEAPLGNVYGPVDRLAVALRDYDNLIASMAAALGTPGGSDA